MGCPNGLLVYAKQHALHGVGDHKTGVKLPCVLAVGEGFVNDDVGGLLLAVAGNAHIADAKCTVVEQTCERERAAIGRVGDLHVQCAEILHIGGLRSDAASGE